MFSEPDPARGLNLALAWIPAIFSRIGFGAGGGLQSYDGFKNCSRYFLKASDRLAIPVRIPFFRKGGKAVKSDGAKQRITRLPKS